MRWILSGVSNGGEAEDNRDGTPEPAIRSIGMEQRWTARVLTQAGTWAARPAAFVWVACYTLLWLTFDRSSFDWHAATTLVTLCMTLVIQRSEHRDTQALQAKLDELLRVHNTARSELTHVDEKEPEEIEKDRARDRAAD